MTTRVNYISLQETMATKSLPVSLRLPPDVKVAAETAAVEDSRSLSSLIEKVLTDFLLKKGYLKPHA